ncbi:hypothetical protein EV384_1123 [Micromonospora kangleipakensis]|uniref:DUF11 domain-containing protein n=1 Tax=Micromonospora kangleipakensis TaxID=1077942 RepID=A0A4Q8B758_9ACTN|nr:hypothetical protein [Micromonospora kangleipakensis]RZU72743.1 hypothetical protein EV384_1123 [Micromonospora kangleipakensis]
MRSVRVTRAFRVATAALAAATMVGAVASPAAAETDPGWVSGWLGDTTIGAAGAPARTAGLVLSSTGATNPRVTFDLSGLAGVATAAFPDWCVTDAASVTCPMPPTATPDEFGTLNGTLPIMLRAVAGAGDGATGTISYTALADGVEGWAQQATVTVHAGPDVIDLVDEYVSGAATGDQLAMPVAVISAGDQPANDLRVTLRFPIGLEPAAYRNCRYGAGDQLSTIVVCTVGGELTPGARYEVPGGFTTTVGAAAVGDKRITQSVAPADTAGALPEGVVFTRRDADRSLRLRQVGEPVDVIGAEHQSPAGQYYLRGIHGAFDVVALGATATGSVGGTVRVEVGLRNDGPGVPDGTISGDNAARFTFTPPAGTTVTGSPAGCWLWGDEESGETPTTWYCPKPGGIFAAGETYLVAFDLRIDGPAGAPGEVRLQSPYPRVDDDPANDTAPVTVS